VAVKLGNRVTLERKFVNLVSTKQHFNTIMPLFGN